MTELRFTVPVVAHRMFGLRTQLRKPATSRASGLPMISGVGGMMALQRHEASSAPEAMGMEVGLSMPSVDTRHGTRMTVEKIRAVFHADPSVPGTDGFTVNSIWESTGIRFVLLAVVDEAIDSHIADYLPVNAYFYDQVEQILRQGRVSRSALHMLFLREMEGRNGIGEPVGRNLPAWVWLGDFVGDRGEAPAHVWRHGITVAAHELGHALKLPHMSIPENLMWGMGVTVDSREIKSTQVRIAQEAASRFRMPETVTGPAPHHAFEPVFAPVPSS